MNYFNQMYQGNPFMQGGAQGGQGMQGGLLGMSDGGPSLAGGLLGIMNQPKKPDQYEQMAAPYAQWAAQQLQQVAPETVAQQPQSQQFDPTQQQALGQMWDFYQRQNSQPSLFGMGGQ